MCYLTFGAGFNGTLFLSCATKALWRRSCTYSDILFFGTSHLPSDTSFFLREKGKVIPYCYTAHASYGYFFVVNFTWGTKDDFLLKRARILICFLTMKPIRHHFLRKYQPLCPKTKESIDSVTFEYISAFTVFLAVNPVHLLKYFKPLHYFRTQIGDFPYFIWTWPKNWHSISDF